MRCHWVKWNLLDLIKCFQFSGLSSSNFLSPPPTRPFIFPSDSSDKTWEIMNHKRWISFTNFKLFLDWFFSFAVTENIFSIKNHREYQNPSWSCFFALENFLFQTIMLLLDKKHLILFYLNYEDFNSSFYF